MFRSKQKNEFDYYVVYIINSKIDQKINKCHAKNIQPQLCPTLKKIRNIDVFKGITNYII